MKKEKFTLETLAREAGVSIATASRAFKANASVNAKTRQRIIDLARKHNFSPSKAAQQLAYQRVPNNSPKGFIRVFTRNLRLPGHEFYLDIMEEIRALNDWGFELIISQFKEDDITNYPPQHFQESFYPDGVVFIGSAPKNAIDYYHECKVPIVLVDEEPEYRDIPWIASDSFKGFYQLMKYLTDLGHRRIALAHWPMGCYSTHERFNAYRCALLDAGIMPTQDRMLELGRDVETVCRNWKKYVRKHQGFDFTAIVGINDIVALGIVKGCKELDIAIPEDLSVAGFDDIMMLNYATPALTTVKVLTSDMGKATVSTILALIRGQGTALSRISLKSELVIRDSCAKVDPDRKPWIAPTGI